jgi:hypothetical protein
MQYYVIVSQLNGFALDIDGSKLDPRTRVFTWPKHGKDNQQFYDDPATGTIRSKINNFCLDFENGQLCMNPFQQGDPNQQWERRGNQIANRFNQNEVLDVAGSDKNQGAKVTKYQVNGGPNQSWTFEYVGGQAGYPSVGASTGYPGYPSQQPGYPGQQPGYPGQQPGYPSQQPYPAYPGAQPSYPAAAQPQRQEFYIVSEMSGKVLDIKGGSKDAGAQAIMWSKGSAGAKNQRWYFDQQGFIRSALNDMAFTAKSGDAIKMTPATGDPHSQWRFDGNKVVNQKGDALDISRENHSDGAEVIAYKQHGKANQRWKKENA